VKTNLPAPGWFTSSQPQASHSVTHEHRLARGAHFDVDLRECIASNIRGVVELHCQSDGTIVTVSQGAVSVLTQAPKNTEVALFIMHATVQKTYI
jgi:hypothetical protein